jgi:hypothetical protein
LRQPTSKVWKTGEEDDCDLEDGSRCRCAAGLVLW